MLTGKNILDARNLILERDQDLNDGSAAESFVRSGMEPATCQLVASDYAQYVTSPDRQDRFERIAAEINQHLQEVGVDLPEVEHERMKVMYLVAEGFLRGAQMAVEALKAQDESSWASGAREAS